MLFKRHKIRNQLPIQTNSGTILPQNTDHNLIYNNPTTFQHFTLSDQDATLAQSSLLGFQTQVHRCGLTAPKRTLCTNFLLADSLTLDWHPIFNMLLSKLKNCLELNKTWLLTHLPGQTIREQIPCSIEEEVKNSLRLPKTNYTPINKEREKRQQKLEKN